MKEFSAAEAAALLGVSSDTVRRRVRAGTLRSRVDGHRVWILLDEEQSGGLRLPVALPGSERASHEELVDELRALRDLVTTQLAFSRTVIEAQAVMCREAFAAADRAREELRRVLDGMPDARAATTSLELRGRTHAGTGSEDGPPI